MIVTSQSRGVAVRVLLDHNMACVDGSVAARLRRARVRVRLGGQQGMMHHKFAAIDAGEAMELWDGSVCVTMICRRGE